ncbi:MAG: hypothetical protein EOO24_55645, partial [Comamonadaceae bacterium]
MRQSAVLLAVLALGQAATGQTSAAAPPAVSPAASRSASALALAAPSPAALAIEAEGMAMRLVSLLRGAPEVGQALATLDSRQADEKAARLSRFPRLDLQGEAGSLSTDLARDARSQVDSRIVAGTRYTLYDFGRT